MQWLELTVQAHPEAVESVSELLNRYARGGVAIEEAIELIDDGQEYRVLTGQPVKVHAYLPIDGKAEEAMNFYVSIFKNSKVVSVSRYGDAGPGPKGSVMVAAFQLEGQDFFALNGGPQFTFTPAISFFVNCETQQEVDELWEKLSAGGKTNRCGWLNDKYGVSWQIVPTILPKLMQAKDPEKSKRVMNAMLQMDKLDIARLQQAYDQS